MSDAGSARLLGARGTSGGGLTLPEAFREVLVTLHDNGPSPERLLRKVIREQLEYKQDRILAVWGTWDAFCADILGALEDGGFITQRLDSWEITPAAVPGEQLTVLRDPGDRTCKIRVTFHSPRVRQAREVMARARILTEELLSYLGEHKELDPVLARAYGKGAGISAILQAALQGEGPGEKEEGEPAIRAADGRGRRRKDGRPLVSGQNAWYRDWAAAAGWHTHEQARAAWNELFPHKMLLTVSACAFRHESRRMIAKGMMERRLSAGTRGPVWQYHLVQ